MAQRPELATLQSCCPPFRLPRVRPRTLLIASILINAACLHHRVGVVPYSVLILLCAVQCHVVPTSWEAMTSPSHSFSRQFVASTLPSPPSQLRYIIRPNTARLCVRNDDGDGEEEASRRCVALSTKHKASSTSHTICRVSFSQSVVRLSNCKVVRYQTCTAPGLQQCSISCGSRHAIAWTSPIDGFEAMHSRTGNSGLRHRWAHSMIPHRRI